MKDQGENSPYSAVGKKGFKPEGGGCNFLTMLYHKCNFEDFVRFP